MRAVAETLRLGYAQFLELELFTRIGGTADEKTREAIERGRRIRAAMVQPLHRPLSAGRQVALLVALEAGLLDAMPIELVGAFRDGLDTQLAVRCPAVLARLEAGAATSAAERTELTAALAALAAEIGGGAAEARADGSR